MTQCRKDLEEELELIQCELGKPHVNERKNDKYRRRMEDAVAYLRKRILLYGRQKDI